VTKCRRLVKVNRDSNGNLFQTITVPKDNKLPDKKPALSKPYERPFDPKNPNNECTICAKSGLTVKFSQAHFHEKHHRSRPKPDERHPLPSNNNLESTAEDDIQYEMNKYLEYEDSNCENNNLELDNIELGEGDLLPDDVPYNFETPCLLGGHEIYLGQNIYNLYGSLCLGVPVLKE
jgi:hypothetical protein